MSITLLDPEIRAQVLAHLDSASDSEVKELAKRLLALENFSSNQPIQAYEPIRKTRSGGPHAFQFHCAPNEGRGMFGGNQSSKTYTGTMEDAFHFCNQYPKWYPEALRFPKKNIGRIIVKDFPHSVSEVIEPALRRAIHPRFIESEKSNNKGYLMKMKSITGAAFDIITHDMDTKATEGWQGDWAHFDEPPPRDKWVATLRGLIRKSGRWWITCTPLDEPWMYDEVYLNPRYFIVNVDMRDNPYLDEEAIKQFEEKLTEEEKEARIHGRFMHLSGLTYKEFDPSIHIKPATFQIPPDWPRWMVCDPHGQRPFAMAWFAVDPLGRRWWYDEWPHGWFHEMKSSTQSAKDYVHLIREKEMGQNIYRRIIDGRAGKAPALVGSSDGEKQDTLIDMFADLGIFFEPSYITMTTGIADPGHLKVKEMLRVSPVTNEPSMFVLSNCKNLIYSFQHNTWETGRASNGTPLERQSQFAKDFLDLVRYGEMDDPHWMDEIAPEKKPSWAERNQAQMEGPRGYGNITDW